MDSRRAKTLEFPYLLRLIDDDRPPSAPRSPPRPASTYGCRPPPPVGHCWTRYGTWARGTAAGPPWSPQGLPTLPRPEPLRRVPPTAPRQREALLAWSAESTARLLSALWWGGSQSPKTCGAVAQHQVQEVAVHTYDAQIALGAPQPLPDEAALDGVDESLSTCCATPSAWPHEPAAVDYHATEGRSWRLSLSAAGETLDTADASLQGTASELVLALYGRVPVDSLKLDGDRRLFDQLLAWDPEE